MAYMVSSMTGIDVADVARKAAEGGGGGRVPVYSSETDGTQRVEVFLEPAWGKA